MHKKIFILGMGAQKTGTSAFHKILSSHYGVNFGPLKEYHAFDASYSLIGFIKSFNLSYFIRYLLSTSTYIYVLFFWVISLRCTITGDLTPANSTLCENKIRRICSAIEKFGFELKILLILRDPAERIMSAIKMFKRLNTLRSRGLDPDLDDDELLLNCFKMPDVEARTRYEIIIENLNFLHKEKKLILINENLKNKVSEINKFFKTSLPNNAFSKKYKASYYHHINDDVFFQVVEYYLETYLYCFKNFPITKKLWYRAYVFISKKYPDKI